MPVFKRKWLQRAWPWRHWIHGPLLWPGRWHEAQFSWVRFAFVYTNLASFKYCCHVRTPCCVLMCPRDLPSGLVKMNFYQCVLSKLWPHFYWERLSYRSRQRTLRGFWRTNTTSISNQPTKWSMTGVTVISMRGISVVSFVIWACWCRNQNWSRLSAV